MLPRKRCRSSTPRLVWLVPIGALLALALTLTACSGEPEVVVKTVVEQVEVTRVVEQEPETVVETVVQEVEVTRIVEVVQEAAEPEAEPLPEQADIRTAWAASAHGNTYDLGKGPNTYCSRCHSPQNWDPESTTDRPPNCVTCKFPTDEEVRMASTMDFVEEGDWVGIVCETCHIMQDDASTGVLAWYNQLTGEHDPVNTPNELCAKCHLTSSGVSASGGTGVTHEVRLGGSAHKNWAGVLTNVRKPEYCSECHDPHTQMPKQCVDCHTDILSLDTHIKGMNAMHGNVSCMACHDSSEAEVGPHPNEEMGGLFVPVLSSVDGAGNPTSEAIVSHSIQWLVNCHRCHYAANPWNLSESVSSEP